MPIEPYSACPGGTGKKIKFCCPDLLGQLQKIERMLDGGQHQACLKHVEHLEQSHPDKACLLAVKTMLLRALERIDEAQAAAATFLEKYPENPIALAETAILSAATRSGRSATKTLMRAIAVSGGQIHDRLYEAMGLVSRVLAVEAEFLAARALASIQLKVQRQDRLPLELTARLNSAPNVPLVIKEETKLRTCPAEVPWKPRFDEALSLATQAQWLRAAEIFAELAQQVHDAPPVWRNLATLRAWMADAPGCTEALRRFATLDVPLEDAVEAEALALFLSEDPLDDGLDLLNLTYPVEDADELQAALSSAPQAVELRIDPGAAATGDAPPPKAAFILFDRAPPEPQAELTIETLPSVLCQVQLYGKETDRDARLEVLGVVRPRLERARSLLAELGDGNLGAEPQHHEVAGNVSATQDQLTRRWRLPHGSSREDFGRLAGQYIENTLLETWPRSPLGLLDGKPPLEAADLEAYRVKLLAAILVVEFWLEQAGSQFDFNRLRSRLGLPTLEPIDPQRTPIEHLPLVRWSRVMVDRLPDEALVKAFGRAIGYNAQAALRNLAAAVAERPGLAGQPEQLTAFEIMAQTADDSSQAIGYLDRGRQAAEQAGQSTASWDLTELALRLGRQEFDEASRLLDHLQTKHIREPGVAQALTRLLVQTGVLRPDGTLAAEPAAPGQEGPSVVVPGAEAAEPGKLWTPDSQKPAGEKPKIWTPGMD